MRKLKGNILITNQAASEFLANRLDVISDQAAEYQKAKATIADLQKKFEADRKHPFVSPPLLAEAVKIFGKLQSELDTTRQDIEKTISNDPYLPKLCELIASGVLMPSGEDSMKQKIALAETRIDRRQPPGYCDAGKTGQRPLGDTLLWLELMEWAKKHKANIILVTDDSKEDWWLRKDGKTISPRPELIEEFWTGTGQRFYLYQPSTFIEHAARHFNLTVKPEAVTEARDITDRKRLKENAIKRSSWFKDLSPEARNLAEITDHASIHKQHLRNFCTLISTIPPDAWSSLKHPLDLDPVLVSQVRAQISACKCIAPIVHSIHGFSNPGWNDCCHVLAYYGSDMAELMEHLRRLPDRSIDFLHVLSAPEIEANAIQERRSVLREARKG